MRQYIKNCTHYIDRFVSTFLMWRIFSMWQIFSTFKKDNLCVQSEISPHGRICLHRHRLWCLWQIWGMARFWKRQRIRKTQQMLRGARWRRRSWRLLEEDAGEAPSRVLFALQVKNSIMFATVKGGEYVVLKQKWNISQRIGSCLSRSFVLWWPTQSSPLSSTTMIADFNLSFSWELFTVLTECPEFDVKC